MKQLSLLKVRLTSLPTSIPLPLQQFTRIIWRITGPAHPPTINAEARFPADGQPLEVVVASGGAITGHLRSAGYAGVELEFELQLVDLEVADEDWTASVDGAGRFSSPKLPAGDYAIFLSLDHHLLSEHGGSGWRLRLEPALATVALAEGETEEVDLDGSSFDPGEVHGRVLLDGLPASDCRVLLVREGTEFGQFVPNGDGRFVAKGLPPGTWGAELIVGDYKTTDGDVLASADRFELAPGGIVTRDCAFNRRRVTLLVIGDDGATPLADTDVDISADTRPYFSSRHTAVDGRLVLDPAPRGEIWLRSGELFSDAVTLPTDGTETELRVELHRF
jgi:hypothetical protein